MTDVPSAQKSPEQKPPETKGLPVKVAPSGALVDRRGWRGPVAAVVRGQWRSEGGEGSGVAAAVVTARVAAAKARAAAKAGSVARELAAAERRGRQQGVGEKREERRPEVAAAARAWR